MNIPANPYLGNRRANLNAMIFPRQLGRLAAICFATAITAVSAWAQQNLSIGPSAGVVPATVLHAVGYSAIHTNGFTVSSSGGTSQVDVQITNIPAGVTITPSPLSSFTPQDPSVTTTTPFALQIAITNLAAGTYTLYVVASSTDSGIATVVHPFTIDVSENRTFWVGTNNSANAWSTAANWSPLAPDGHDVVFEDSPLYVDGTNVVDIGTNTVSASTTIGRLTYLRSKYTTYWRTILSSGVTLTVTNGFAANSVDIQNSGGNSHTFGLIMSGSSGATLLVTNYNKDFSLNMVNSAAATTTYTYNLSSLPNLKAYVNRFGVLDATIISDGTVAAQNCRVDMPASLFVVAKQVDDYSNENFTNAITFIGFGDSPYQNGQVITNTLGAANVFWADSFVVGAGRVNNAATGLGYRSSGSTAQFRNSDGVSRMSLLGVGVDRGENTVSSGCRVTFGLTRGSIDALVDKLWLGRCRPRQGGGANAHIRGILGFGGGTLDANTAVVGYQAYTNDNDCVGSLQVTGTGTLVINQEMVLGYSMGDFVVNGSYAENGYGQLIISGASASARINKITVGGPGNVSVRNDIAITSGGLILSNTIGTASAQVNVLGITNGSLTLHLNGLDPRVYTRNLASSGTATINFAAITNIGAYPAQIPLISYENNTATVTLGTLPSASPAYTGFLSNNTANGTIDLVLTAGPVQPGPVTWTGSASSDWDILTTTNWLNGSTPYIYGDGVPVSFDDSASSGTVNLTTTLSPSSITVNNSSLAYVFSGTGNLSGTGSLTKQGSGSLTIANTGFNDFTGSLTISGGTVQVGNADTSGSLGYGSILNNSTLVFNRSDSLSVGNNISGTGSLTVNGSGTVALSGTVACSGATVVNTGTLQLDGDTDLGDSVSITIAAGATLNASTRTDGALNLSSSQLLRGNGTVVGDVNAVAGSTVSPGLSVGVLSASGAATLSGTTVVEIDKTGLTNDLLQADSITYGGTLVISNLSAALEVGDSFHVFEANDYTGSFDSITPSTPGPGLVWDLSTLVNGTVTVAADIPLVTWTGAQNNLWDLTTTNWSNFGSPATYTNDWTALFDDNGANTSVSLTTGLSPYAVIVSNNATAYTFTGSGYLTGSGKLTKYGPGTLTIANSTANDFTGNLTIIGGTVQIGSGGSDGTPGAGNIINNGTLAFNRSGTLTVANAISGSGTLAKSGNGTVTLSGTVTHNGSTMVNAGTLALSGSTALADSSGITVGAGATLDVSARTDGTLTLPAGQTLNGDGSIAGDLVSAESSLVTPGQSIGTLLASGAVTLQGTTLIEIDKTANTNDLLGGSSLTFGGTLVISNLSEALADGDTFKVFDAGSYAGAFASILPKRPGTGLAWDTNELAEAGIIKVTLAPPVIPSASIMVDFSIAGRAEAIDPNFSSWVIYNDNPISNTFSGITVTFTKVGPYGTGIAGDWWKAGVDDFNCLMADDGLTVENGNLGGQIEMRIHGLSAGTHTIATYHNTLGDPASYTFSPINISVNGVLTVTNFVPSNRVTNNYDATSVYLAVDVAEDEDVVVLYQSVTTGTETHKNVVINGLEIDTVNSTLKALNPLPKHRDEHVDADADKSVTLSWTPAASAVSHDVYFGMSSNAVYAATNGSAEFIGNLSGTNLLVTNLSTFDTYWWRVDEINETNGVAKGDIWYFRTRHLAFPGAEGYGRFARGGRQGVVLIVTNLADSGPGTFRWAVTNTLAAMGPRTIIFNVSGLITLESPLTVSKDNSKLTIAGQTAPGKGINIRKYAFGFSGGEDIIVRHLRVYPGNISGNTENGIGFGGVDHAIMDHCSSGWSMDECIPSRGAQNMTIQKVMIAEPLNAAGHKNYPIGTRHGYASSTSGNIGSWHHNLLTHSEGRNWSLAGGLDGNGTYAGYLDIINNVVYNWNGRTTDGGVARLNFIGNYYKVGPANGIKTYLNVDHGTNADGSYGQMYYQSGNIMPGYPQNYTSAWYTNQPFWPDSYVTTQTASNAYKIVMSDVGCTQPLIDDHDTRVLNETRAGTYTYVGSYTGLPGLPDSQEDVGGWENYPEIHRAADFDSDNDGLPDWWEEMKGLNPNSAPGDFSDANADLVGDEYTELERYLNWMAEPHTDCARNGTVDFDLSTLTKGFTMSPVHSILSTTNGSAVILGDGITARFTATTDFSGLAELTFYVVDSMGDTMTNHVGIHVLADSNHAPTLDPVTDKSVNVGVTVLVTNVATDIDTPAQTLTFSLPTAPSGALISTNTGVFTWRPTVTDSGTVNPVTVVVTDDGTPALSATQSFSIYVNVLTQPGFSSITRNAAGQVDLSLSGQVGPDYAILTSTNLTNWDVLIITNSPPMPISIVDTNTAAYPFKFYRLKAGPPLP